MALSQVRSYMETKIIVTSYNLPEVNPITCAFPLHTVNGIAVFPPQLQKYGCKRCKRTEMCEMVLRLHGKWAMLPCETILVSEITGEILFGVEDEQDGEDEYYKVSEVDA